MTSQKRARWRSNLEARLADEGNDRGVALLTALMFMIFATGLSLVLLSAILSQAVPAYTAEKNTRTVYAAQAGLQSALAIIRSAAAPPDADNHVFGAPEKLPCSVTGNVAADGTGASYSVAVEYFTSDPTNMTPAWRTANKMACSSSTGVATVPKFAYVAASGQDAAIPGSASAAAGNRALSAIYQFKITNINIAGGMIFNSNNQFCMEAVAKTAGQEIKFTPAAQCLNTALQLWIYAKDYQLKLASTVSATTVSMCITGPVADGDSTQKALLQPCQSNDTRWNQLWSWTGDNTWGGQKKIIADGPGTYCLQTSANDGTDLSSKRLQVKKSCWNGSAFQPTGSFTPSLSVGAGAAGYGTHQIVNYQEFGRCADVTDEVDTSSYMIVYPCKQDPTGVGTYLKWNHKWYYTEPPEGATTLGPQQIYIDNNKTGTTVRKCLTSPTASGVEVTFTSCNTSARQEWTRVENTGDYSTSYLFLNSAGKCLVADTSSLHNSKWSKVRVANCNGSLAQKWNAPPTYTDATFGGYREVAG